MGDMISAITHQWKQPLTSMASSLILLKLKLQNKEKIDEVYLEKKVTQVDDNIQFLAHTIDDFKEFFSPNKIKKLCNLEKLIHKALSLNSDILLTSEITIHTDLQFQKKGSCV